MKGRNVIRRDRLDVQNVRATGYRYVVIRGALYRERTVHQVKLLLRVPLRLRLSALRSLQAMQLRIRLGYLLEINRDVVVRSQP